MPERAKWHANPPPKGEGEDAHRTPPYLKKDIPGARREEPAAADSTSVRGRCPTDDCQRAHQLAHTI